ncbi:MAG: ABC transporter substrate-binding protein, partial [Phycisphaerales bacterium]|nr:ABC transporter substrate-binding protein [Phycisphaerales bacterium]
ILSKLSDYEHIVLLGYEETGRVIKQAKELGINAQFFGIDVMASEAFRDNTGGEYEDVKFAFWEGSDENSRYVELMSNYKNAYGTNPENVLFLATGYDAMLVLGKSLKACGDNVDCVKVQLGETKDFPGATGLITIDEDHITRSIQETIHMYEGEEIIPVN